MKHSGDTYRSFCLALARQVLSLKERAFVRVACLSGMSGLEIIFRELTPHML